MPDDQTPQTISAARAYLAAQEARGTELIAVS